MGFALLPLPARAEAPEAGALRQRLATLKADGQLVIAGVTVGPEDILADFYRSRAYAPAWTSVAKARDLLGLLAAAEDHGLEPRDFFVATLQSRVDQASTDAGTRAETDLLLTEALIRYGYQRRFGKVNPTDMEPAWNFERGFAPGSDPVKALAAAIAAPSLAEFLDKAIPAGPWYRALQRALAHYRSLAAAGGWPALPDGPALRPGEADARVPALRERLAVTGDLSAGRTAPAEPTLFDDALAEAVRRFQARHGLAPDGVVGARSREALNVPAGARVDQLRLSLERVRWLAGGAPSTYVAVNIAGFHVAYVRDLKLVWSSRVVVGRAARQTPIFMGRMTYIELNPTWTIPPTILREDVLPRLRRDPDYLRRENITVLDRSGARVDPATVDWSQYRGSIPYTLRQEPGPANALGRVKLMFPNPHAVYLHDTPSRGLFDKPERTFSSGCIRVEDPLALAALVLDDPAWTRARLEAAIDSGQTRRINLSTPVPVLLVYLTAVAGPDGEARFFRDIYGRDARLLAALDGPVRLVLPGRAAHQGAPDGAIGTLSVASGHAGRAE